MRQSAEVAGWVVGLALVGWLSYRRWQGSAGSAPGVDFGYTISAAREIAAGRSPYLIKQYVYPPPLALLFAPFVHVSVTTLWRIWLAVLVGAPTVGVAAFLRLMWSRCASWGRPIAFTLCGSTVLYSGYYPVSRDLALGQSDTLLFAVISVSVVAAATHRPKASGLFVGLGGLIKVWPWAAVVSVFQPGTPRRGRTVACAAAVALIAPLSALAFGWSGFAGFVGNGFDARQQNLVSDSVWTVPQLLFAHTDLAQPVADSPILRVAATVLLAGWVVGLLVAVVRIRSDRAVASWNVIYCLILLLPVSHRQYALCVLPLLWWWTAEAMQRNRSPSRLVAGLLLLWWVNQTIPWPYNGNSNTISAALYSVPFLAGLGACTASVIGACRLTRGSGGGVEATAGRIRPEAVDLKLDVVETDLGSGAALTGAASGGA